MSWIKIRKDLFHDPAVISIAAKLGLPELHVVGMLARVWAWADDVTGVCCSGAVPSVTLVWIDRLVCVSGFAEAMVSAGWLASDDKGIVFPHFDRHMSKTAKERAQHQLRQESYRNRDGSVTLAPSRKKHKTVTREDERREDDDETPSGVSCSEPAKLASEPPAELRDLSLYARDASLCKRWSELFPTWREAYPGVDVLAEVKAAHAWEVANPDRRKVNRPKFLTNWLKRAQDRGGGRGGFQHPDGPVVEDLR
jgi:hypothetical protein